MGPRYAAKADLTCWDMDSMKSPNVSCMWHQEISSRSFKHCKLQDWGLHRFNQIPHTACIDCTAEFSQHLEPVGVSSNQFWNIKALSFWQRLLPSMKNCITSTIMFRRSACKTPSWVSYDALLEPALQKVLSGIRQHGLLFTLPAPQWNLGAYDPVSTCPVVFP